MSIIVNSYDKQMGSSVKRKYCDNGIDIGYANLVIKHIDEYEHTFEEKERQLNRNNHLIANLKNCNNKRSKMGNYYAVARGRCVGVYHDWSQCRAQVDGYRGARFKKFASMKEANQFIDNNAMPNSTTASFKSESMPKFAKCSNNNTLTLESSSNSENVCNADTVEAYTDGACSGNGSSRAKAGIGVHWRHNRLADVSQTITGLQTNNRAEIGAAIHAILQAKQSGFKSVIIHTDSNLLFNSQTQWKKYWMRNGWRKADGSEVKNKDDYIALENACRGMSVEYRKVLAHSGIAGNDEADRLAKAAIS